jgi:integrase
MPTETTPWLLCCWSGISAASVGVAGRGRPPQGVRPQARPCRRRGSATPIRCSLRFWRLVWRAVRIARNPAAGVRLPRIVRRDMHFLAVRQVEDLAAAIDPRYELLVRFAAYTGLRAGELVALRVRHLNLLRGRCEVGESATEVDGRLVWGPTKTYASRTVPLPRESKGAGHRPVPIGGGGETRTRARLLKGWLVAAALAV